MPGLDHPIEYWILKHQIEKNKMVQNRRDKIIKERAKYLSRQRNRKK